MSDIYTKRRRVYERNIIKNFFPDSNTNEMRIDALLFHSVVCDYCEKNKVIYRYATIRSILAVCVYKAFELHNKYENDTLDKILHSLSLNRGHYFRAKIIVDNIIDEMSPQIKSAKKIDNITY